MSGDGKYIVYNTNTIDKIYYFNVESAGGIEEAIIKNNNRLGTILILGGLLTVVYFSFRWFKNRNKLPKA